MKQPDKTHIEIVEGTLSIGKQAGVKAHFPYSVIYVLKQTGKDPHAPVYYNFTPPLPEDTLIEDLKVGKNSQTACAGWFKASILRGNPPLGLDYAYYGMDLVVALKFFQPYEGKVVMELHAPRPGNEPGKGPPYGRLNPLPFGHDSSGKGVCHTQVPGDLHSILVAPHLHHYLEKGTIKIKFFHSVYDYNHKHKDRNLRVSHIKADSPTELQFEDGVFVPVVTQPLLRLNTGDGIVMEIVRDEKITPEVQPEDFLPLIKHGRD